MERQQSDPALLHVLLFEFAGQRGAIPSAGVREIVRAVPPVGLPSAPAIVHGVIDVRGTLVPVFDVGARFGLPSRPVRHDDHLILATTGSRLVALHIDRALDVALLDPADIGHPDVVVPGVRHVAGIAKLPDGLVLVHDLDAFLSEAEAAALDEALEGASAGGGA